MSAFSLTNGSTASLRRCPSHIGFSRYRTKRRERKTSLLLKNIFPITPSDIPCSLAQGISPKNSDFTIHQGRKWCSDSDISRHFPVFFPVSREFAAETGSRRTASSAKFSSGYWILRECRYVLKSGFHVASCCKKFPSDFNGCQTVAARHERNSTRPCPTCLCP